MKTYRKVERTVQEIYSIFCDKCEQEFRDTFDVQECKTIKFSCGYGSVFEDGGRYELDLCQSCAKELLGPYLRYVGNDCDIPF